MPPERGRASQACSACRKQKTRCYASASGGCLRCERIREPCSLDVPTTPGRNGEPEHRYNQDVSVNGDRYLVLFHQYACEINILNRLSQLEQTVQRIVQRLDNLEPNHTPPGASASRGIPSNVHHNALNPSVDPELDPAEEESSKMPPAAPVFVLRDVAREVGTSQNDAEITNAFSNNFSLDIIDSGVLTFLDASSLLAMFVLQALFGLI